MTTNIEQALASLETEHGFRILYACESGSRAWGFASTDSDYDVRFLYVWPQERYLGIFDPPSTIDCGIDENALDLTGWDVRKALPLFRKANGSLLEWLHSPIVYREAKGVIEEWRSLARAHFVPSASAAHYLGLSTRIRLRMTETETVTAKSYLYVLRSLLAARFVVENCRPIPVAFDELRSSLTIPDEVALLVDQLMAAKARSGEADVIERDSTLDRFIEEESERLRPLPKTLPGEIGPVETLDTFFLKLITQP